MAQDCIFCKIVAGELPCDKVFEDDEIIVFKDINPQAEVHLLAVTKKHIVSLAEVNEEDYGLLGRMIGRSKSFAEQMGSVDGFRTVVNTGRIGRQDVLHLHVHVLGGSEPLPAMIYKRYSESLKKVEESE